MYCKECGKQIVIDSKFCIYCGTKVDVIETPNLTDDKDVEDNVQQVVVSTLVDSPVKVEIASKEPTIQKSAIANELIANFKILGIALLLWGGYVLCFMAIHQKDIKPLDDSSWFGESCYDPNTISGNWEMDWRIKYAFFVEQSCDYSRHTNLSEFEQFAHSIDFKPLSSGSYAFINGMNGESALNYANKSAKEKKIPQEIIDKLQQEAKDAAQKDKDDFRDYISDIRMSNYKNDLSTHMKWAALVAGILSVIGRYFIKSIKWVLTNRTVAK